MLCFTLSHFYCDIFLFVYMNSDEEDTEFGDCTVMIEDEAITASQQVG